MLHLERQTWALCAVWELLMNSADNYMKCRGLAPVSLGRPPPGVCAEVTGPERLGYLSVILVTYWLVLVVEGWSAHCPAMGRISTQSSSSKCNGPPENPNVLQSQKPDLSTWPQVSRSLYTICSTHPCHWPMLWHWSGVSPTRTWEMTLPLLLLLP